jgi:hypothetical protein
VSTADKVGFSPPWPQRGNTERAQVDRDCDLDKSVDVGPLRLSHTIFSVLANPGVVEEHRRLEQERS